MSRAGPEEPGTIRLPPHPTSPAAARRHVTRVLESAALAELVDTTALLVSELVTNAVLHAATSIDLCCKVDHGSVCVEVRDRSKGSPRPRHHDSGSVTGRGLEMVDLLADQWGVDTDADGKTVWFVLAGPDARPAALRRASIDLSSASPQYRVHLLDLPPELVLATIQYGDALLREVVLLSIAEQGDQRRAAPQSAIDLGPLLAEVEAAVEAGHSTVDLVVELPQEAGPRALERLGLVDEADRMARDGDLLMPPAPPEIGVCRWWLLSQIGLQAEGAPAVGWSMPEPLEPVIAPAQLPEEELRLPDTVSDGVIVADDGNRILYVNDACAALLGWDRQELVGRRLVTIVPPDLRAAHLAGFTRYLMTGEAQILGAPVRLPALRRDGSVVEVDLGIEMAQLGSRQVFRATLAAAEG